MDDVEQVLSPLLKSYPGSQNLITQLATLFNTTAPPSIHVHSPFFPGPTASLVRAVLEAVHTPYASVNGVECLGQRLFFDRVLHELVGWRVEWDQGCESFGAGKYNSNLDGFIQGLRAVAHKKQPDAKLVIVVERAERLKENLPDLMVPLTRLAELSRLPVTIIFISEVSWFDLRPPYGAAVDPYLIDVSTLSTQDAISTLISFFPARQGPHTSPYSYHLKPLYAHYASTIHSVCSPFLADIYELAYIAAACWPCFVSPLLADWRTQASIITDSQREEEDAMDQDSPSFALPSEEARMRLVRYFTPSFKHALETLYPREQHAQEWSRENMPSPDMRLSELLGRGGQHIPTRDLQHREPRGELTTVAKYVIVAAFLASHNPAKSDVRLVGRAPDERARKRRGGGGPRKGRGGGTAKIPQKLLGPAAFPLDRLIAILGSLMEEHDDEVPTFNATHRDEDEDEYEQEKDTEMAVGRIQVSATISELVTMRLLHRTTPADKIDGPPSFKCGISQPRAFELARELGIGSLADFMWDPN